jgi:hypothetical protein
MDGDLVISSNRVDFGEDGTPEKLVGVVMDMQNGIAVGNYTGVEHSVIVTGMPHVFVLGYDVERLRQEILGAASCAVPQYGVESGFGDCKSIRCQSPWSAGDRWASYSPDVVDSIMADFSLDSGLASQFREFCEEAFDRCAASDGLYPGDQRAGGFGRYGQRRDSFQ